MQICCSWSPLAECACRGRTCTTDLRVSRQQSASGCITVPCHFSTQYSILKLLCGIVWVYNNSSTAAWLKYWFDAIITALLLRELFRFYNECDISVVKHISSCNYSSHDITSKSRNCAEENNLLHHEEKCNLKKSQATAGSITTVTIKSFI